MVHLSEREQQLPEHVIGKLVTLAAEDPSILSLGPGEPDFDLPQPLVNEIKRIAHKVNHYAPPGGYQSFKEAFCKKLKKDNKIRVAPENVVATTGSQEGLLISAAVTLDVSEQILLPNPGYMAFLPTMALFNANPVSYGLRPDLCFEPDPDEIRKKIDKRKTKVLLINSPANPTGNVIRKKVLEEIADIAVDNNLLVFSDEAYEKILYDGAKHVSIASLNGMQDRTFSFFTFSKTYAMCGFRLGAVVAPEKFAQAITDTHEYTTISAPAISQRLGEKALSLSPSHTERMVREYDRRRKVIVPRLNELGLETPKPKGAFYAFSNISDFSKNSKKFAFDLLKKQKVAVVPGCDFGTAGEAHIRCSFATDVKIIEKAMDRLEMFLKKHRNI